MAGPVSIGRINEISVPPELEQTRPHVLGWGEPLPRGSDVDQCPVCGGYELHDIITLGPSETLRIIKEEGRG